MERFSFPRKPSSRFSSSNENNPRRFLCHSTETFNKNKNENRQRRVNEGKADAGPAEKFCLLCIEQNQRLPKMTSISRCCFCIRSDVPNRWSVFLQVLIGNGLCIWKWRLILTTQCTWVRIEVWNTAKKGKQWQKFNTIN